MADDTTTTEPQPLTDAQIKQRDELNAKAAAYEAAQAEKSRKDRLDSLATTQALVKLLSDSKVTAAFEAALTDTKLDFETKARISSLRQTFDYQVGQLNAAITAASATAVPTPTPGA